MIKKLKNKKGFAMAELLAVSMVVLILFSVLFSNYLPLVAEYENRFSYNDVTAQYAAHYISKIYDSNMYKTSDGKANDLQQAVEDATNDGKYYTVYNEAEENNFIYNKGYFSNDENQINYNKKVIEEYKIKEIIITTFKLDKLKGKLDNEGGYPKDGALYNYIKYLPKYENAILEGEKETYRVIIKTDYGYATTSIKTSTCKGNTIGEYTKKDSSINIANEPVLDDNMIPVYYDTCVGQWKKADVNNEKDGYRWYNYDEKVWANSVTVKNSGTKNRDFYIGANPGTEINMDDILTMQVWIPRYKYKVWNYNADGTATSEEQEIEITFEDGTATTGEIECQDAISGTDGSASETCELENVTCTDIKCNNKTYTHPAFTFGDDDLKGFWIGKFEISPSAGKCYNSLKSSNDNVKQGEDCDSSEISPIVKPGQITWRYARVSTFETSIMAMNDDNNKYGLATNTDTHMIKNMEWGAVAYLSHSKYGVSCSGGTLKEIGINDYSDRGYIMTGCGSDAGSNGSSVCNEYVSVRGQGASTTGNVYGVYDMSGGAREYTMSNIVVPDYDKDSKKIQMISGAVAGETETSGNSGFNGKLYVSKTNGYEINNNDTEISYPEKQYYDMYSFCSSTTSITGSKLGDGIRETFKGYMKGWYKDEAHYAYTNQSWFFRGGVNSVREQKSIGETGIFASGYYYGKADSMYSTRVIIVPKAKENE